MTLKVSRLLMIVMLTTLVAASCEYAFDLESELGLNWLFKIRGPRLPTEQVVIVAMDEKSELFLGVNQDLIGWRPFHEKLVYQLKQANAALIIFDLQFIQQRAEDAKLAQAFKASGNVLVPDCIQKFRRGTEDFFGREDCSALYLNTPITRETSSTEELPEEMVAVRKIQANPVLGNEVLDHAPFHIIKDSVNSRVREAWLFYEYLNDTPSLPLLIWSYYLAKTEGSFFQLPTSSRNSDTLQKLKHSCPDLRTQLPVELSGERNSGQRVINILCGADTMLLDFYGPPQTFRMVSYSDVYAGKIDGLKDKIVLVGKVNRQFTNNIDTFFTPFSTDRSGKMAGVEILATQIANLVENRVIISPLPPNLIYLIFSLLISMPACFKIIAKAGLCSLLISLVYLLVSAWLFTKNAYWLPVAVPILVILPLSQLLIQGLMRREIGNANRKLRNTDELTNLSNRRKLIQDLDICINNSEANGSFCALMLIDLDNFKFINEVYGHGAGDALLIQVAHSLFHHLGRHDLLARLGDDEFVVLTTDLQSDADRAKAQCEIVVRKIATCFQKLMLQDGTEFHCTATVGITLFKGHQFSTHEILKYADITLHYAKKKGRNTWQFFDPEMEDTLQKEALLNNYLRQAIERNEFILYYQAQISDNKIVGAEVLIRWLHPTLGMIPPLEFIALAEESGLIIPIGNWVLETACRKLHDWQSQPALAKLILAVNVSVPQFHQPNFVQQVLHICEKTQVNPRRLKLELTESIFVGEFDGIKEKMSEIKSNGISFSLDDFGTGYSALSYLSQLSFEQLKIDQSFVCNLLLDPNNAAITKNIVDLARTLNLHVIAEGVETIEQLHVLAQLGCNSFQGYLFSKPLPIEQFEKYLYSYNECGLNLE